MRVGSERVYACRATQSYRQRASSFVIEVLEALGLAVPDARRGTGQHCKQTERAIPRGQHSPPGPGNSLRGGGGEGMGACTTKYTPREVDVLWPRSLAGVL